MAENYKLELNAAGNQIVNRDFTLKKFWNKKITWSIKDNRIDSFKIVARNGNNPFEEPLSTDFVKRQVAEVDSHTPIKEWLYDIDWVDTATKTKHKLDPKISIKPAIGSFALLVATAVLACTTIALAMEVKNLRRKLRDDDRHDF